MKKILGTMSAAALLTASAFAPAMAQTTPAAPEAPATQVAPATPAAPATVDTSATVPAYIVEQAVDQVAASDFIGKTVYNAENEGVGNITDLILEENGGIVAAIIGVGGFLGIGEKSVAVPVEKIVLTRNADNRDEVRLTTTETKETLNNAPEFRTLERQRADAEAANAARVEPAAPAAPAPAP